MTDLIEHLSPLTKRQRDMLEFIRSATKRRGYPPSVREVGEAVGLVSPSSVAYQLKQLHDKGYIRRDPARPRALVIMDTDFRRLCPTCGGSGRTEVIGGGS